MSMATGEAQTQGGRRRRRQLSEINVTPMVDVMLVLLIVFMVTAPLLTVGVTVASGGEVYLQDSAIELGQLGPRLAAITEDNREARIFVRGDKAVDYGRVMTVMGAINQAGFTKVALVTEFGESAR